MKFTVKLICCGRDDGEHQVDAWDDAEAFREAYVTGPGVFDHEHPERGGHQRSAIITKSKGEGKTATPPEYELEDGPDESELEDDDPGCPFCDVGCCSCDPLVAAECAGCDACDPEEP